MVSSTNPTSADAVSNRHSSSAHVGIPRKRGRSGGETVRLSAAPGSTHAIGSLPMLSTLTRPVPKVSRTIVTVADHDM